MRRLGLRAIWASTVLGGPLDRIFRRRFREVWALLADSSALRALAVESPPPTPMPYQGRVVITDVPADRLFGFHPVETDTLGRSVRWSGPLMALRLPMPAGSPCRLTLELHPACVPARRVAVVAAGRRVPPRHVTTSATAIAIRLEAPRPNEGGDVLIGIRCGVALRDPRRLGLAVSAIRLAPIHP
jgi:hypothetical protein